jgi:hypothetical protein
VMSTFSTIGIILLVLGIVIFGYQGLSAFLGMGASDEFVYENISFADILDEGSLSWIDSISSPSIRSLAETLINVSIAVWMLFGALLCFVIHAFRGPKHIK